MPQQLMNFPYFTAIDPKLIRADSGRDPLGLLPVWSAFGRDLVPYLATPVRQLNGVKAVLLIHRLEKPMDEIIQKSGANFRSFFRLMEGLLEYYLWNTLEPRRSLNCYGTRALAADEAKFSVKTGDARTAVNGLYQYYRGTCRRAGLLGNDWTVSPQVEDAIRRCWSPKATNELSQALKGPLADAKQALKPAEVLEKYSAIRTSLKAIFESTNLKNLLGDCLLGEPSHVAFAKLCAQCLEEEDTNKIETSSDGRIKLRIDRLVTLLEKDTSPASSLREPLGRVQQCEPFLLCLEDCFSYMLASPGTTLASVSSELSEDIAVMRARAKEFLKLKEVTDSGRMLQILCLADLIAGSADDNLVEFLLELLRYHKQCMAERGRDPWIFLEVDKLIVIVSADMDKKHTKDRIKKGTPWVNEYYLWTADTIYKQLFGNSNA
jgi:uncharacterized protein (DUF2132 family)